MGEQVEIAVCDEERIESSVLKMIRKNDERDGLTDTCRRRDKVTVFRRIPLSSIPIDECGR